MAVFTLAGAPLVAGVASSKAAVRLHSATAVGDIDALRVMRAAGATNVIGVSHASGSTASVGEVTGDFDSVDGGSGAITYKDGSKFLARNASATIDATWLGITNNMTGTSALTITLPQNSDLDVPAGKFFYVINGTTGAGSVTFAAGTGATVLGATTPAANATVRVTKTGTNGWSIG